MTLVNLSKEELCLISIALNAYQMELDNYHLEEMAEVSTKVDALHKVCTCKEQSQTVDKVSQSRVGKDMDLL